MTYNLLETIELREVLKRLIYLQKKASDLTDIIDYYNELIAPKKEELNTTSLVISQIYEMFDLKPKYRNPDIIRDLIISLYNGTAHTLKEAVDFYEKQSEEHTQNL
ncbi:MAG: hypothetical protein J1F04_08525 [Oscillospiraceae bacterium]|nr:hypothetical protein [Oscillospiraceae bacterium]